MKKSCLIFMVIALSTFHLSQAQITFQKGFGIAGLNIGIRVHQTTDGGYIISGVTSDTGSVTYPILIKTNQYGDTLWTKLGIGGYTVIQTADGGYMMNAMSDLVRTDSLGNILWTKNFISHNYLIYSIRQTPDGGFVAAGSVDINSNDDVYLTRTDSAGNLLWAKRYGDLGNDRSYCVQLTSDSGVIITGRTTSFGSGNYESYLLKTDSVGNLSWSKCFAGLNTFDSRYVVQTNDGGYVFVANNSLIKTDASGDSLWTKVFSTNPTFVALCVQQTTDGGYILTGGEAMGTPAVQKAMLLKTDSLGNPEWMKAYDGYAYGNSVEQTADGGYIITGDTYAPNSELFLIKTDSLGNSGCNETNESIIATNSSIIVKNPATQVTNDSTIVSSYAISSNHVVNVSTLCTSVGISEKYDDNTFYIFPNPSSGDIWITFEKNVVKGKVRVLNIFGEKLYEETFYNESEIKIDITGVSAGIYFVNLIDGENSYCRKIIIQPYK